MDKDSVVNFLTPTKLVHGSIKSKPRVNLYQSQQSNSSNRNKQELQPSDIPPYSFTAQFDKLNRDIDRSRGRHEELNVVDQKGGSRATTQKNYILNNTSKTVLKSEDNYKGQNDYRYEDKSSDTNKPVFNLQPVQYSSQQPPVDQVLSRVKNSNKNSRVNQMSRIQKERSVKSRQQYPVSLDSQRNMHRLEGSMDDLAKLMNALQYVKQSIDVQLSQLQNLLDNTSRYLSDINEQYLRVKQRILDYTSQVLDASFTKYKENMVNWTKYQDVEKRTIAILAQLQKTIKEDSIVVAQMARSSKGPRVAMGKLQQLEQKIQFYGNYADQIRATKAECVSMRPQIRKERVQQFERSLAYMAQF